MTLDDPTIEPGQTVTIQHGGRAVDITLPQDVVSGVAFTVQVEATSDPPPEGASTSIFPGSPPVPPASPPPSPASPPLAGAQEQHAPPVMNIHGRRLGE